MGVASYFRRKKTGSEVCSKFAFTPEEIGCADPTIVEPMVIFTVPHVPWSLKPIQVPRAHIPMLMKLLKQKVELGILKPSSAPYSNRWFTVPKKNGTLRFIQDLQPVNKVTIIRNTGVGPLIDEFAEAFAVSSRSRRCGPRQTFGILLRRLARPSHPPDTPLWGCRLGKAW